MISEGIDHTMQNLFRLLQVAYPFNVWFGQTAYFISLKGRPNLSIYLIHTDECFFVCLFFMHLV